LIRKVVDAVFVENDVIEESDTEKFSGLAGLRGESTILGARCGIAGRVIVGGDGPTVELVDARGRPDR
jgi:hypothetical protein